MNFENRILYSKVLHEVFFPMGSMILVLILKKHNFNDWLLACYKFNFTAK